ncbi:MAG: excinuclease ABC subunit UvrC [Anaerorhabdus sp.]
MKKLNNKLKNIPETPGCYLMKDKNNIIIYVGKAKNLRNRVNQYFEGSHDFKTTKMVSLINDFDFIITNTEKEALILEINLIKKHRPRYNIIFMDDKSYPYIKITSEKYPKLEVVREAKKNKKDTYFGPYPDASAAHSTIKVLQSLYPIVRCKKMPKKVCLYYHLNQCLGPCVYPVDINVYQQYIKKIQSFLKGDVSEILKELNEYMEIAIEKLEYEKAITYRDYINSIKHISSKQQVQFEKMNDCDVFTYCIDRGYIAIQGFFLRNGQLIEKELSLSVLYGDSENQFIAFISQYYEKHPIPKEVVLPSDISDNVLAEYLNTKILFPKKGKYKKLVDLAYENAKKQLELKFDMILNKDLENEKSLKRLAEIVGGSVDRIDIFDNSHLSGSFNVSSCVVFDYGKPNKNEYRHYKLDNYISDIDSMKEVVYRRYHTLLSKNLRLSDCIIVDGGMLQINATKEVLSSLLLDIPVFGLVKNSKHQTSDLMNENGEKIEIDRKSQLFFLLVKMQDEVHRFAISYHKKLRSKNQTKSILCNVEGIGDKRKQELLTHFKNIHSIKKATISDLSKVIPLEVAQRLYDFLKVKE